VKSESVISFNTKSSNKNYPTNIKKGHKILENEISHIKKHKINLIDNIDIEKNDIIIILGSKSEEEEKKNKKGKKLKKKIKKKKKKQKGNKKEE
jgi:hypothetical protein